MSTDESIDEDTAQQIRDSVEAVDEDVTTRQRWWAYAQLAALFGGVIVAGVAAVLLGYVTPELTITATVSVGWLLEYLIIAFVVAFLVYVFALLLIALPGSIIGAIASVAYGIAASQGLIEDDDEE
ncbi:MAG: hypothetical protein ACOCY1_04695 [Halovenus sp.]